MDKKLYCEEIEKIKASNRLENNIENQVLWQEKDKNDRSRKLTWRINSYALKYREIIS